MQVSIDAETHDRILAWFLVQPMNIATGRFGSYPEISVIHNVRFKEVKGESIRGECNAGPRGSRNSVV